MTHEMYVEPGEVVEYFFGGDTTKEAHPAIVIAKGMGSKVELGRLDPALSDFHIRDGVPHVADRSSANVELFESGGWRLPQRTLASRKAMFDLGLARWSDKTAKIEYGPFEDKKDSPVKKSA